MATLLALLLILPAYAQSGSGAPADSTDPNSVGSNSIRFVLVDQSSDVWLGTRGNGLDRFDPGEDETSAAMSESVTIDATILDASRSEGELEGLSNLCLLEDRFIEAERLGRCRTRCRDPHSGIAGALQLVVF